MAVVTVGEFHTSSGPQIALGRTEADGNRWHVAILSEISEDELVAGQTAHEHNVEEGTQPGQFEPHN